MWVIEPGADPLNRAEFAHPELEALPTRTTLTAARNETVSFRFAVHVGNAPISNAAVRVNPVASVTGSMDISAVSIFRMHALPLDTLPGWHLRSIPPSRRDPAPLDVLVPVTAPRGGLPPTLDPGKTYHFWVDVAVPEEQDSGYYATELVLTSGGMKIAEIEVRLEVYPFALPTDNDIPVIAELDHKRLFRRHVRVPGGPYMLATDDWRSSEVRAQLDGLLVATMRTLRSHRLTPVLFRLGPKVSVDARRNMLFDWDHYDSTVEPFMDGSAFNDGRPLEHWPLPFHALLSLTPRHGERPTAAYQQWFRSYLAEVASHFEERGWLVRSYALLPWRTSPTDTTLERIAGVKAARDLATGARAADDRIRVAARLWPQDMEPYGWQSYGNSRFAIDREDSSLDVDIWMPPAQFFDRSVMASQRQAGRSTWLTVDRPPFSGSIAVHAPASYVRVLPWQAKELGAEALYVGCINAWPSADSPADPADCVRTDPNVLLYPGAPFGLREPVPSLRLKLLRRGLQDAAYGTLLTGGGLDYVVATVRRSLAPRAGTDAYGAHFEDGRHIGWVQNSEMYDLARHIMARAWIDTLGGRRTSGRMEEFTEDATWRRFLLATRKVRMHCTGARVRLSGLRTAWDAEIDYAVTVANGRRVPVGGSVRLTDLPQGWSVEEDAPVPPIPPNASRHVTVTARTDTPPLDVHPSREPATHSALPSVLLVDNAGAVHRIPAAVAFAAAIHVNDGSARIPALQSVGTDDPRIDGDLSDWPPGSANVLSGFSLITDPSTGLPDPAARRPQRSTIGFVLQDDRYLYVAINCEGDIESARGHRLERRNRVDYEDMVPMGGELVEILMDPLNSGTRSPGDLYHIVIKPSGTYLTERGVRFHPPCGPTEPWPVSVDVATAVGEGRWTAEIRIPLDAFDTVSTSHTVWGFNITRFDAANQEFSTWSGAAHNAYDPLSLGNLYLP